MKKIEDFEAILFVKIVNDFYEYLKEKDLVNDFIYLYGNMYLKLFNEVENNKKLFDYVSEHLKNI